MAPHQDATPSTRDATVATWRSADAVCFDVDSTVITSEGIDDLAEFCGVGDKVREMTMNAMGGNVTFRKALQDRLSLINPSQSQIKEFIAQHPPHLTPGIKTLVELLQSKSVSVFLVSGGFHEFIDPVAEILNIPNENVFANRLYFHLDGSFGSFDMNQLTSESGGKGRVIQNLKEKRGFHRLVMVGDAALPPLTQIHNHAQQGNGYR